jgi:hypothetical protein
MNEQGTALVYRIARRSLVFAPPDVAERVTQIHRALGGAASWGELVRLMPVGEIESLKLENFLGRDDAGNPNYPHDSTTEPYRFVPGYAEGSYPPSFQARQDEYLPREICLRFGVQKESPSGRIWSFAPAIEAEMVLVLRQHGFIVTCRSDLTFW